MFGQGVIFCIATRQADRSPAFATTCSTTATENNPNMKERGKAAGVKGWIVKPFKGDAVIATFKKLCE